MADDLIERLREAYGKVAAWPENRMKPDAVEDLGEGFTDLLKLRNLAPEAADALAAKDKALEELRAELERVKKALCEQSCPRPCNGRPDYFSIGACVEAGEYGCGAARAQAEGETP